MIFYNKKWFINRIYFQNTNKYQTPAKKVLKFYRNLECIQFSSLHSQYSPIFFFERLSKRMIINYVDSFPRETLLLCLFWIQIKRARLQRNVNHRYIRFVSAKQWLHFDGTNFLIYQEKPCSPSRMAWFSTIYIDYFVTSAPTSFFNATICYSFKVALQLSLTMANFYDRLHTSNWLLDDRLSPTKPNQTKLNQPWFEHMLLRI